MGSPPKIGLIDYGQVKRLTEAERLGLAKTIYMLGDAMKLDPRANPNTDTAAFAKAKHSIAAHCLAIGMKTEKMLEETMYEMSCVYMGRMDPLWLYPRNLLQWSDMMQEVDGLG